MIRPAAPRSARMAYGRLQDAWTLAWQAEQRHAMQCRKFGTFAERYCRACCSTHAETLRAADAVRVERARRSQGVGSAL